MNLQPAPPRPVEIAQITDPHIGTSSHSQRNADRLRAVIAAIVEQAPNLTLVTGDLTEDGAMEDYRHLRELLAPLGPNVALTFGNHDDRTAFFAAFPEAPRWVEDGVEHGCHATQAGDLRIVLLDTLEPGRHSSGLDARRLAWLDAMLAEAPERPTLIALHHPPVRTGVPWIDSNAEGPWSRELRRVAERHAQVVGFVAGHVHQPIATSFAGRPLIIAGPSAMPIARDTRPIEASKPDGRRLILNQAPAYAMHRWDGARLVSWFGVADDAMTLARYDASTAQMIAGLAKEEGLPPPV